MPLNPVNRIHSFLSAELGAVDCIDHTGKITHGSCRIIRDTRATPDSVVVYSHQIDPYGKKALDVTFSRWGFAIVLGALPHEVLDSRFPSRDMTFIRIEDDGHQMTVVFNGFENRDGSVNGKTVNGMGRLLEIVRCRKTKPKKIALAFIGAKSTERHGIFLSETGKHYQTEIWERESRFKGFYNSFSQIVNESVLECDSEFIFWIHPRVTVDFDMLDELLLLLCSGYAFVSEINFGFFGCSKQLFRKIGLLDERFVGSEHEDTDWFFRMKMHSIPYFERGNTSICPDDPHVWGPLRGISHTLIEEKWVRFNDDLHIWEWPYDWCLSKFYNKEKMLCDGISRHDIEKSWGGIDLSHGVSFIPRLSLSCNFHDNRFDERYVTVDAEITIRITNHRIYISFESEVKTFLIVTVHDDSSKVIKTYRILSNRWFANDFSGFTQSNTYEIRVNSGQYRVFHGFMRNNSEQQIRTGLRIKTVTYEEQERKCKVFIPQPIDANSEMNLLVMPGLLRSSMASIVGDAESADVVLYHYSGEGPDFVKFNSEWSHKSVMIDYQDDPFSIVDGNWSYYFKRSTADKSKKPPRKMEYFRNFPVINLPYCVKEVEGKTGFDFQATEKEFDVCCMFELECEHENRRKVVNFVDGLRSKGLKVFTGLVNWKFLNRRICDEYFDVMRKSRIIVTCNPQDWEGDYRLFEALTTGSLVFCDRMSDSMGLDEDVIWYDIDNLESVEKKIFFYLSNPDEMARVSQSAYNKTRSEHTSDARVKFMLETITKKNK